MTSKDIAQGVVKALFTRKKQPLEKAIDSTGIGNAIFDIPVAGGLLRGAENSLESYGRAVGGATQEGMRPLAVAGAQAGRSFGESIGVHGQTPEEAGIAAQTAPNMFLDEGEIGTFSNPKTGIPEMAGRTANAGLTAAEIYNLLGFVKSIDPASGLNNLKPYQGVNPQQGGGVLTAQIGGKAAPQMTLEQMREAANGAQPGAIQAIETATKTPYSQFNALNPADQMNKLMELSKSNPAFAPIFKSLLEKLASVNLP